MLNILGSFTKYFARKKFQERYMGILGDFNKRDPNEWIELELDRCQIHELVEHFPQIRQ